ncbi:HEAT repeat domain-containing protein [Kitasatospora sp. NPDC058063]|uniref:HEAT repeat domain-containing protein n=1 Tax=unclassified Kitasatospora TaxID=2633591 RepID=UPI0036DBC14E
MVSAATPSASAMLAAQLRSPDAATRYDAIAMTRDLISSWHGDHTGLVLLLADCLLPDDPYTTAEAADTLGKLPAALAEPAREALAALVEAHRTTHGPNVWAARHPLLRRAHQQAVTTLAGLGDERALPGLLTALDTGTDDWRAVQVAGCLPQAAGELLARLIPRLADADFSWPWGSAAALMAALNRLGDAEDPDLRFAAVKALWDIESDPADAVPRLTALLDTGKNHDAADVLGRIGGPAAAALPRLRQMLEAGHAWTRVHAAAAIHDIGGPAEAETVLPVLLEAWEENDSTATRVMACLQRMGPAAAPARPRIGAELALARRSGDLFSSVEDDEELQRAARAVIDRTA